VEPTISKPRLKFKPPLKFFKFGHWLKKNLKPAIKYFSSPIYLQILYLFEIADFSHGIEFIFKAVIGQYNLQTIFLHCQRGKNKRISKEREKEWIKD